MHGGAVSLGLTTPYMPIPFSKFGYYAAATGCSYNLTTDSCSLQDYTLMINGSLVNERVVEAMRQCTSCIYHISIQDSDSNLNKSFSGFMRNQYHVPMSDPQLMRSQKVPFMNGFEANKPGAPTFLPQSNHSYSNSSNIMNENHNHNTDLPNQRQSYRSSKNGSRYNAAEHSRSMSSTPGQRPNVPLDPSISKQFHHPYNYHSHHPRSSSSSNSSSDLYFIERRKHNQEDVPRNYRYKGSFNVDSMVKKYSKVPCDQQPTYPMPPPPPPYIPPIQMHPPPAPNFIPVPMPPHPHMQPPMHCSQPFFDASCNCGYGSQSVPAFNSASYEHSFTSGGMMGGGGAHVDGGGINYPPLPPGAKIIAQYVRDLDEVTAPQPHYSAGSQQQVFESQSFSMAGSMNAQTAPQMSYERCEKLVETCVPKKKIIEVYRKNKKKKHGYSLEKMREDIIHSITFVTSFFATNHIGKFSAEISKIDRHDQIIQPQEKQVKVIVQPIQPVFYMPQNTSNNTGPAVTQPVQPPQVIYVPRNVYVPVVKPVFVPRERIIVRPQIVHVARPVVIDRPVPVTQRPIVIERDRPVPVPVQPPSIVTNEQIGEVQHEQYVYNDNVPTAYGGRTGEFAYGLNYGYQPKDDRYRYIVSGCDSADAIGNLFTTSHEKHEFSSQYGQHDQLNPVHSGVEAFDESIAAENRQALFSTFRRAGTEGIKLEVLDPTVKPGWERIDAQGLIERYGSLVGEQNEHQYNPSGYGKSQSGSFYELNAQSHSISQGYEVGAANADLQFGERSRSNSELAHAGITMVE